MLGILDVFSVPSWVCFFSDCRVMLITLGVLLGVNSFNDFRVEDIICIVRLSLRLFFLVL